MAADYDEGYYDDGYYDHGDGYDVFELEGDESILLPLRTEAEPAETEEVDEERLFLPAPDDRNALFHELFSDAPEDEYLLGDFQCALESDSADTLHRGRMFISVTNVCFHADTPGRITQTTKLLVPIRDIITIQQEVPETGEPTSDYIIVTAREGDDETRLRFTGFRNSNVIEHTLNSLRISVTSEIRDSRELSQLSLEDEPHPSESSDDDDRPPNSSPYPFLNEGHPKTAAVSGTLPGSIGAIRSVVFDTDFTQKFLVDEGMKDVRWSSRSHSDRVQQDVTYNKPLAGLLGPKWSACKVSSWYQPDLDRRDSVFAMIATTYPEVTTGGGFYVKTILCFQQIKEGLSRMFVTTQVEWVGRHPQLDEVIGQWSLSDQKTYYESLHLALFEYITERAEQFLPASVDRYQIFNECALEDTSSGTEVSTEVPDDGLTSKLKMLQLLDDNDMTSRRPKWRAVLRDVLSDSEGLDALLGVEKRHVSAIVDKLHLEIRETAKTPALYDYRRKCMKCLRALVEKYHTLPRSLFVNEVTKDGLHPLTGGGFSDIWKGLSGGAPVCLKVLRIHLQADQRTRDKLSEDFYKEALLWTQLSHPNLLPFLGVNTTLFPQGFCLVSPWMVNGDVVSFLREHPHDKLDVISQIAAGMSHLHSLKIVHGDIKGANVLVNKEGRCHLADFGLAVTAETTTLIHSTSSNNTKGSLRWMAPELFHLGDDFEPGRVSNQDKIKSKYGRDIYAFACTVLEVITGKPPFPHLIDTMVMFAVAVRNTRPSRPPASSDVWCPDPVWSLVQKCWEREVDIRPKASEVHAFLTHLLDTRKRELPWEVGLPEELKGYQLPGITVSPPAEG